MKRSDFLKLQADKGIRAPEAFPDEKRKREGVIPVDSTGNTRVLQSWGGKVGKRKLGVLSVFYVVECCACPVRVLL